VKVCKEMVDGMGRAQSTTMARFKSFCFTAFTILRRVQPYPQLVALMVDANIPDISTAMFHEQISGEVPIGLQKRKP